MGDALCGPSNALQNIQKHASVDRTLQQDRLISRQSPSQVSTCKNQLHVKVCHSILLISHFRRDFGHKMRAKELWTRSSLLSRPTCQERHYPMYTMLDLLSRLLRITLWPAIWKIPTGRQTLKGYRLQGHRIQSISNPVHPQRR